MAHRQVKAKEQDHPVFEKADQVAAKIEVIDPIMAQDLLDRNDLNPRRNQMNPRIVDKYAADMRAGRWHFTGEAIQVDDDDHLLNGQHRLAALIKAEATLPFLVLRGVDVEAAKAMDQGYKRTASQILAGMGHGNTSILGAAARMAILRARMAAGGANMRKSGVSNTETLEFIAQAGQSLVRAVEAARRHHRQMDVPSPTVLAYAVWRLRMLEPYDCEKFLIDASEKVGLDYGDPVLAMTNRFAQARRDRTRLSEDEQLNLLFRAWNARREGRTLEKILGRHKGKVSTVPEPV